MTTVKTLSLLSISALMTGAMSLGALAQPAPVGQDRAAVQAETRRAAAAGTLQPAGEAPDPIGGSATPRKPMHTASAHHRHGAKKRHRARHAMTHANRAASPAPEPMTEPKK